jgi:hypothetical protein
MKIIKCIILRVLLCLAGTVTAWGQLSVNPNVPFYGGGTITANPAYPIVGENTHITVNVGNNGAAAASNVSVKISFNDWGVTFNGWQEIGTVVIPNIPAGGTALAEIDHVFVTRTHTCLEAVIIGADQNDDPNDDRGQINLEVLNAGETFSYWVPVVNNGDQPLDLLVVGRCEGRGDGTAPAQVRCKHDDEQIHLEPGEEMLVPVELDLRGVPPGHEVRFVLDAYDLGAANPFAPANHNYIELRIVRQAARSLEQMARAQVNNVRQQVGGALQNRLDEIARQLDQALRDGLWTDANHVRRNGGAQVFASTETAVKQLLMLLDTDMPATLKEALNKAALDLTDAMRIVAETANQAGGGVGQFSINDGDAARLAGEYAEAIAAYKRAWQSATR